MDAIEKMCAQIEEEEKIASEEASKKTIMDAFENLLKGASRKEKDRMLAKLTGQEESEEAEEEPKEAEESEEAEV